ncbi:MAG TPA: double zinc ribbon domain-containing protein [Actinomycetota bacterium]|nr:double zinc ribbon domain-containing protein [Actinomycetota bacterium]
MLNLLFAPRCAACNADGGPMCGACAGRVGVLIPPWCARCGRPTETAVATCPDCPPRAVAAARSPFLYDGPIADAIRALKFRGWGWLARSLAAAMAEVGSGPADIVTWVPLSRRRRARRGFDQAELLARETARRLGLPCRRLLRRTRDTPAQTGQGGRERRASPRDAFRAVRPSPSSVLLVDDVMTTGATAAACADVLRRAGARTVRVLTAARSLGRGVPARCFREYNRAGFLPGSVVAREVASR